MNDTITTHADAADVIRGALPGAPVRIHEYPRRHLNELERPHERLVVVVLRAHGRHTGEVCLNYKLPCSANDLAVYAKRRVEDAIKQRTGRTDVAGETYMADGHGGEDVTRMHEVRA